MSNAARVESIDAVRAFKVALFKFAEAANVALDDADGEMGRTLVWLEGEQRTYWQSQLRKRHEAVVKAKEALQYKKVFKDASGRTPSAVDEEKALAAALKRLEEAEHKFANVRRYSRQLQREIDLYKGSVEPFATSVQVDIPRAAARLDKIVQALEAYVAFAPAAGQPATAEEAVAAVFALGEESVSMAQPEPPPPEPPPKQAQPAENPPAAQAPAQATADPAAQSDTDTK